MKTVLALGAPEPIGRGLEREGHVVVAAVAPDAPALLAEDAMLGADASALASALASCDALVLDVSAATLTSALVALCDRLGVRVVPVCADSDAERLAQAWGLAPVVGRDADAALIASALTAAVAPAVRPAASGPSIITVWGALGSPGRTTAARELAVELARGAATALVDADAHAPSLALGTGLPDEGPGFAAACRQAEYGGVDARELARISQPLGRTGVAVLTGINRPARWPELTEQRVTAALAACRGWVDHTVVDVAAPLERDEEIVSDLDGLRRNAATIAALRSADLVVAVLSADPVGVSRFLRAYPELRATVGATPVVVAANRVRPGPLGVDARGQVRRALERFAGVRQVWFLPDDPRAVDAAMLAARPIAEVAPRSAYTLAMRRFAGEAVVPVALESVVPRPRRRRAVAAAAS